jgi:predicted anti-sigma-YlaC factor YlaD
MADCPTRFTIASLRAGDLPPTEAERVESHVARCEACRAVIDEINANVAEYESRADDHLANLMRRIEGEPDEAEVVPLAPRRRSRVVTVTIAVGALAVAAMLALVLVPTLIGTDETAGRDEILFKGSLAVEIVAKRGPDQFRVIDGTELRAGDAIRFVVDIGAAGWISVFSIDAAGRLSPFYPDTDPDGDPEPLRLDRAGSHELPGSIILDESRGHEEIVVVFSKTSFDRGRVHRQVTGARSLVAAGEALGPDFALERVRVTKEPP